MQLSNSNGQTSDLYRNQKHLQYTHPCISQSRHCYGNEKGLERQAQGCWLRSICIAKQPSLFAKDWQPTATPISRERAGKTRTRWLVKVDLQCQTVLTLCKRLAAYNINTMKRAGKLITRWLVKVHLHRWTATAGCNTNAMTPVSWLACHTCMQ